MRDLIVTHFPRSERACGNLSQVTQLRKKTPHVGVGCRTIALGKLPKVGNSFVADRDLVVDFRVTGRTPRHIFCARFHRFTAHGSAEDDLCFNLHVLLREGGVLLERRAN